MAQTIIQIFHSLNWPVGFVASPQSQLASADETFPLVGDAGGCVAKN